MAYLNSSSVWYKDNIRSLVINRLNFTLYVVSNVLSTLLKIKH
jgi:hypothetical protein